MIDLTLTPVHKALNAKMVDYAGYNMPVQYEGVIAEHLAVRNNVGVFDVSHMGEIFISGDNAEEFLQYITSNDVSKLFKGRVQYSCLPNSDKGIVDDILVYKIDNNSLKIFTDTPNLELPSIIIKFSEKDIKIEDIHIPQTSLEDVFLDLTGRKIND